mgnify:CR=1 FL=1
MVLQKKLLPPIFGLFSIFRGFVKELFSIIGWVAAILLAIYSTPLISPKIEETLPSIPHISLLIGILIATIFIPQGYTIIPVFDLLTDLKVSKNLIGKTSALPLSVRDAI